MPCSLAKHWWSLVVRGGVGIALGIASFAWPDITLSALVLLFGVYALIDGVVAIAAATQAIARNQRWGALIAEGIAGICAGLISFLWPPVTLFTLIYVIGTWAIVTGALELAAAVRLRKVVSGEWLLALAGVASIVFGIMLYFWPLAGAVVMAMWIGAYALIFGVVLAMLGLRLRSVCGGSGPRLQTAPDLRSTAISSSE